jgi:hypothetical protein
VFFALQGPLHELSDLYLFSAHMVQHLLITLVFPPLFIQGIPPWMWRPLVRHAPVAAVGRAITHPVIAFLISTFTLYLWHVPTMYDWALEDHNVHIVEHLTFMTGAVIMWWPVWSRVPEVPALTPGRRMIYLFLLTIPMKGLGAIITVSDYVLYRFYAVQPRVFGLDPLADQRLAQVGAQRHRPQPDHGVALAARGGARHLGALIVDRRQHPGFVIGRTSGPERHESTRLERWQREPVADRDPGNRAAIERQVGGRRIVGDHQIRRRQVEQRLPSGHHRRQPLGVGKADRAENVADRHRLVAVRTADRLDPGQWRLQHIEAGLADHGTGQFELPDREPASYPGVAQTLGDPQQP